ncbi:MAG: DUF1761 domain-containing protein [Chloroflexota bacterium]
MVGINYLAVVVAGFVAFVASAIWYIVFGKELAKVSPAFAAQQQTRAPWKMAAVIAQSIVIAFVLAYIIARSGATGWLDAAWIGFILWLGFSAMQWVGSILWENVPLKMALIHGGDWLMKMVLISVIIGIWR